MGIIHNCGVAGVFLKKSLSYYPSGGAAYYLHLMLEQMQNRGQLSGGIVVYCGNGAGLKRHVGVGLVDQVFRVKERNAYCSLMNSFASSSGIGHVRYATSGNGIEDRLILEEAQPFLRAHGRSWKEFAIAFNGNLTNDGALREELIKLHSYNIKTSVDTEVIMHFIAIDLKSISEKNKPDLSELVKRTASRFDGAFNIALVNGEGELIAFRDRHGFRPLVYGENEDLVAIASESLALEKVGIRKFRDVRVGGYVIVNKCGVKNGVYLDARNSHCMFEWVYFSLAPSLFEGISVDLVRERLGIELARNEPLKDNLNNDYIVVPVPDTSIPIAQAMSEKLGLRFVQAIYKNASFGRGFINKEFERERIIRGKYTVIRRKVEGKKLIVVEDSVVRGETFSDLGQYLWENGPLEIHLRSACPPIRYPCFYGIDFPNPRELIATGTANIEEAEKNVVKKMDITTMKYLTIDGLVRAIGLPEDKLCLACLNKVYPTKGGREKFHKLAINGVFSA